MGTDEIEQSTATGETPAAEPALVTDTRTELQQAERLAHEWVHASIRVVVLVLSIFLWSVMGFLVWVPLLLRAIFLMSGAVLYSSLLKRDTGRAEARLQHAMSFFPKGYERLFEAVRGETADHGDDEGAGMLAMLRAGVHFIIELLAAVLFWYLLGLLLHAWPSPSLVGIKSDVMSFAADVIRFFGGAV